MYSARAQGGTSSLPRACYNDAVIPYRDDNPTELRPYVTYALVAANVLIFLATLANHERMVWEYGSIPWELLRATRHPDSTAVNGVAALFTSMFMHGGFMHLGGNMLFLWVFGNNVEDAMGHVRFLIFYLAGGLAAHAGQLLSLFVSAGPPPVEPLAAALVPQAMMRGIDQAAWFIPMVGASGAISAVLAAYYVLYPHARVYMLVPVFVFLTTIITSASFAIGYWFVLQLLSGILSPGVGGGVAWWAHIGGFVGGLVLYRPLLRKRFRQHLALKRRWRKLHQQPW